MKLIEITDKQTPSEVIADLKLHRGTDAPSVEEANEVLDPKKHKIHNPVTRPNKQVKVDVERDPNATTVISEESGTTTRTEKVARVGLALQKLIIKRATSFCFGNPVMYNGNPENDKQELVMKALNRILRDVKTNSLNRKIARTIFGYKECAELWYPVEKANSNYGFKSQFKLRCAIFSPANGDELFPYFDAMGDMVAFSRAFTRSTGNVKMDNFFETYTDEEHWLWLNNGNGYEVVEGYPKPNAIGKIPVVYGYQSYYETEDVDSLIDRLETLLSNFADTNDYHASPKIFTTGEITGWSKKGESGAVIEGEAGSTMQYVSWQNAPESVKLEIETLLRMIYTITQTPDISFDAVKGLGAISGIALKLLFMDAHLKVQEKGEIFDAYLQRRVNIIKAYIGKMDDTLATESEAIDIEPEIRPYMLTSEIEEVNLWLAANGNKPLVSHKTSVKSAGLSQDPDTDFEEI